MRARIWTWTGLLTAIAILPLPAWGQLTVGMAPSRTSGTAPLYVFFDGTTDAGVSDTDPDIVPFRDLQCDWEFGDPTAGTWSNTGKSRDTASGCIAAHVYENPGHFTATFRVSDEAGNSRTIAADINVIAPDVTWQGSKTVCIENGGGFAGCPAGALQASTGDYHAALATYCGVEQKDTVKRCLFRRGDRFSATATTQLWDGPIMIGAFGSGARPVVDASPIPNNAIHMFGRQSPAERAGDIRIVDLEFVGAPGVQGNGHAVAACGSNAPGGIDDILLMGLTARGLGAVMACSSSGNPVEVTDKVALVNNTIYSPDHRSLGFFHFTRSALLNNTSTDGGGASSHARISFGRKIVIEHNVLTGDMGNESFKLPGNPAVATGSEVPDVKQQRFWLISDNHLECGRGGDCIGGYNKPDEGSIALLDQAVIERNYFELEAGTTSRVTNSCFAVSAWRNNVSVAGSESANPFFMMQDAAGDCLYPRNQLRIYNNTFYAPGAKPRIAISMSSGANDSIIRNNLYYTPGDPDTDRILTDAGTGNIASQNLQTNQDVFLNTGAFDKPRDFELDPNSARASLVVDSGFDLLATKNDGEEIFTDFNQKCLSVDDVSSRRDLGAFESGAKTCQPVVSGVAAPAIQPPDFLP